MSFLFQPGGRNISFRRIAGPHSQTPRFCGKDCVAVKVAFWEIRSLMTEYYTFRQPDWTKNLKTVSKGSQLCLLESEVAVLFLWGSQERAMFRWCRRNPSCPTRHRKEPRAHSLMNPRGFI